MDPVQLQDGEANGFPKRLKAAMEVRGFSHRDLARAVGASKNSVTNWAQGHNEPSLRHLRRISRELDISLADLLEDDPRRLAEDQATALIRELASQPIGPALGVLSESAPDLLGLLSQAERYVKNLEEGEGKS